MLARWSANRVKSSGWACRGAGEGSDARGSLAWQGKSQGRVIRKPGEAQRLGLPAVWEPGK